jgi:hypothetical protein
MSQLSDKLATIEGLTLSSVHMGLTTWDDNILCDEGAKHTRTLADEWRITLSYIKVGDKKEQERSYTTTYRTGIGHRKMNKVLGVVKERGGYATRVSAPVSAETACKNGLLIAVKPNIADVMACLLSGSVCGEDTYEDFSSNMGTDTDSRRNLETYMACQNTLAHMRGMFGALYNELKELEH